MRVILGGETEVNLVENENIWTASWRTPCVSRGLETFVTDWWSFVQNGNCNIER